jgi:hypothetical protein
MPEMAGMIVLVLAAMGVGAIVIPVIAVVMDVPVIAVVMGFPVIAVAMGVVTDFHRVRAAAAVPAVFGESIAGDGKRAAGKRESRDRKGEDEFRGHVRSLSGFSAGDERRRRTSTLEKPLSARSDGHHGNPVCTEVQTFLETSMRALIRGSGHDGGIRGLIFSVERGFG